MFEFITGFYFLVLGLALFIAKKRHIPQPKTNEKLDQGLSVIVAFKNEEQRFLPLINALNLAKLPKQFEILFIDDHSTDQSINFLLGHLNIPFTIIRLSKVKGKKQAISQGVQKAKYQNILTLDADVSFASNYFQNIAALPLADLTILPVNMVGTSFLQKLASIEFNWLQSITFFTLAMHKPTLANGANLLFRKKVYLETLLIRSDAHIPSGDDTFLLGAVKSENGKILGVNDLDYAIKTPAPKTWSELLSQRKRWIKKVLGLPTILTILILICYQLIFIYSLIQLPKHYLWLVPLFIKLLIEWIGLNEKKPVHLITLLMHQFYYPIYGFLLCLSIPFPSHWKKDEISK
ncbi:hypothetical protein DNU06_10860 [Putridiphycobacter roseus]|uniref:Glycosyltransferase 2-like domain-containing protein n=1 Tax=Putridiphycobacter roseus TaxID=2219161 RepID=A0A2W1NM83_9FLAO|nr:glycosyltransferase [Putridiphycobacter roseus]PZE16752.1 hypothetical protein DNU06_10860 [Putridiphycobacter roseus]